MEMREENRNAIIVIGILLAISILFYTVYPPLRTAVSIYALILMFSLTIYSNKNFQDNLIGIRTDNLFIALLVGGGIGIGFYILSKLLPGFSFGIPYVPYSVSESLRGIIILVFAPIAEELATRGALLGFILWGERKGGITKTEKWVAIVVQALFFTLLHATAYAAGWYQAPTWMGALKVLSAVQASLLAAFIFGIIFGYIVTLDGVKNLIASIVAHFVVNLALFTTSVVYVGQKIFKLIMVLT